MTTAAEHIKIARIFLGFAQERLDAAADLCGKEYRLDFNRRYGELANQGRELEALQVAVMNPNAELEAMLGAPATEATA